MTGQKNATIYRALFSATTVLLLAFIFGNSAADGEESGSLSLMVTQWLNGILEWLDAPFALSHHAVRKLAHFTEYSALGASFTALVWAWRNKPWHMKNVWLPLLLGGATACADEWLQTFVPDRHGCVSDALLDFCGVLWASLAVSALLLMAQKRASSKTTEE